MLSVSHRGAAFARDQPDGIELAELGGDAGTRIGRRGLEAPGQTQRQSRQNTLELAQA